MPQALVRKRCFVQMIGYEPVGAEHQHRRFIREMKRTDGDTNPALDDVPECVGERADA